MAAIEERIARGPIERRFSDIFPRSNARFSINVRFHRTGGTVSNATASSHHTKTWPLGIILTKKSRSSPPLPNFGWKTGSIPVNIALLNSSFPVRPSVQGMTNPYRWIVLKERVNRNKNAVCPVCVARFKQGQKPILRRKLVINYERAKFSSAVGQGLVPRECDIALGFDAISNLHRRRRQKRRDNVPR